MKLASTALVIAALLISTDARTNPAPLATGLKSPTKIILTPDGNLLVSEAGERTPNRGRVSLLDRAGAMLPLLDNLPSGLDLDGANPTGPTGLLLLGVRTLYVQIGQGDTIVRSGMSEVPNPDGLASALFSSLWRVRFSDPIDSLREGFVLDPALDYARLADGGIVHRVNGFGEHAWIDVVADLRDLYPGAPPNAVTGSNPFGLELVGAEFVMPDAGQNSLVRIGAITGRIDTIAHFPVVPNTAPGGPPVSQAVPNSVRRLPGTLSVLVTQFTGFPFNPGAGSVQRVDLITGAVEPFITGLTMPIDTLPIGNRRGPFLVLEFASGFSAAERPPFAPPGRVLRYEHAGSAPSLVTDELVTPTSFAIDRETGELFVTEIGTGRVVRVTP